MRDNAKTREAVARWLSIRDGAYMLWWDQTTDAARAPYLQEADELLSGMAAAERYAEEGDK